jgi:hypothetical protein
VPIGEDMTDRKSQAKEAIKLATKFSRQRRKTALRIGNPDLVTPYHWFGKAGEHSDSTRLYGPSLYTNTTAHLAQPNRDRFHLAKAAVCGYAWQSGSYQRALESAATFMSHGIVLCEHCRAWLLREAA